MATTSWHNRYSRLTYLAFGELPDARVLAAIARFVTANS
jgi:hypothetical protein